MTGGVNSFCEDCLPDFKRKMCKSGKCSQPTVKFSVDEDGFIHGYIPNAKPKPNYLVKNKVWLEKLAKQKKAKQDAIISAMKSGSKRAIELISDTGLKSATLYKHLYEMIASGVVIEEKLVGKFKQYRLGELNEPNATT